MAFFDSASAPRFKNAIGELLARTYGLGTPPRTVLVVVFWSQNREKC